MSNNLMGQLAESLVDDLRNISLCTTGDVCEALLCASDLGADAPVIRRALARLSKLEPPVETQGQRLVDSLRRQLVFVRYDYALDSRRRFLDYWIVGERFRGLDIVKVSFFVDLALEQQSFLPSRTSEYVRHWFIRHRKIESRRVRAWAPYCLGLAGFVEESRAAAVAVLRERKSNGSWSYDLQQTLGCAYPLVLSRVLQEGEIDASIRFVESRYDRGFVENSVLVRSQTLKLLQRCGRMSTELAESTRRRICQLGSIFLSHNREDKPFVRRLADDLRRLGVQVWVDEAEILPGDSVVQRIEEGIQGMEFVGVVLSNNSVRSAWVRKELDLALVAGLADRRIRVLPIVIDGCDVPFSLRDTRWADFRTNYDIGLSALGRRLLHADESVTPAP